MKSAFLCVLLLATAAVAQDDLVPTRWQVNDKGEVFVLPHVRNSEEENERQLFQPLFGFGDDDRRDGLGDILADGGALAWLTMAFPGAVDIASHCNIEHHFRRLGLGLTDEQIIKRIADSPGKPGEGTPLVRRARLDRLLAVRLAEKRRIRVALPHLMRINADSTLSPFLRDAALDALDSFGFPRMEWPGRRLPPLSSVLARLPASPDIVIVIDQSRVPAWKEIPTLNYKTGIEQVRDVIRSLGAAVTHRDLAAGQHALDRGAEGHYEVARRFGNMRFRRVVAAVRFGKGEVLSGNMSFRVEADGLFEPDRMLPAMEEAGVEVVRRKDGFRCVLPDTEMSFDLSLHRMVMTFGRWSREEGGETLATRLLEEGAGRGDPAWVRFCTPWPGYSNVPITGFLGATMVVSFEGGIRCRLEAEYGDEEKAGSVLESFREMVAKAPAWLRRADTTHSHDGKLLRIEILVAADSPESAIRRIVTDR